MSDKKELNDMIETMINSQPCGVVVVFTDYTMNAMTWNRTQMLPEEAHIANMIAGIVSQAVINKHATKESIMNVIEVALSEDGQSKFRDMMN